MPTQQWDVQPCWLGCWHRSPAAFHSPLPGAEIDDEKSVILIGVNVMEEVEGRSAELDIEEPPFFFLCHVKPDLKGGSNLVLLAWTPETPWPTGGHGLPVAYPHGLVGLEAVHVVGSPQAPGGEELEQVDFHRGFNKHDVVRGQSEAVWKHTGSTLGSWSTWLHGYSTQSRISTCSNTNIPISVPPLISVAAYMQRQAMGATSLEHATPPRRHKCAHTVP